ncbi:DEAD/DEAH box helicase [Neisseria elongata]|jgi:helicase C-terminal domain protein|uniref:DEAD/DEAH box helicase n=1 Tax=Neisseria elongata TaxID=495 RepID=UPI000D315D97|nr:DEAD/DEAH box helicase [Neisseria elongata]
MDKVFKQCKDINDLININEEKTARDILIFLLDYINGHSKKKEIYEYYGKILNHLKRELGFYPYMEIEHAIWQDRYAYEYFTLPIGKDNEYLTVHREQSNVINKLLQGDSFLLSAPTSFGKSFLIDAFISIQNPLSVLIIVPTLALMDETRRRLQNKFSSKYRIITTPDAPFNPEEYKIFIFPQERALSYIHKIDCLDLFVVDEFYKIDSKFDKERSPSLLKAINYFKNISKQMYFIAPNISAPSNDLKKYIKNIEFLKLDFSTVALKITDYSSEIPKITNKNKKGLIIKQNRILHILQQNIDKTLIYSATYNDINILSDFLSKNINYNSQDNQLILNFSQWLVHNYGIHWSLPKLISKGIGIHTGRLHRSIAQLVIKLFEEENAINIILSTSSIIEGVNTSAKNVIIWKAKNGTKNLDFYSYKNVIGRSGRMFKHFVGNVFLLDRAPQDESVTLSINFDDNILLDYIENDDEEINNPQLKNRAISNSQKLFSLTGKKYHEIIESITNSDIQIKFEDLIALITELEDYKFRQSLKYLQNKYFNNLYNILNLKIISTPNKYSYFVNFVDYISKNFNQPIPKQIEELRKKLFGSFSVDDYFQYEKIVTFDLAQLIADINIIVNILYPNDNIDLSWVATQFSSAFLPPNILLLEEFGLPRSISLQMQNKLNDVIQHNNIQEVIKYFNENRLTIISFFNKNSFESYILEHFYSGL